VFVNINFYLEMDSCLMCKNVFVKIEGERGYKKRRITQRLARSDFTALDVLKQLNNYQVQKCRYVMYG